MDGRQNPRRLRVATAGGGQTDIPVTFHNHWRVLGDPAEDANADRICKVTRYTTDLDGSDRVEVAFLDTMKPRSATLSPWVLIPYLAEGAAHG